MKERIAIQGMSCGGCVRGVESALERLELKGYNVEIGSAEVEYDPETISHDTIIEAIEDAGYDVPQAA